MNCSRLTYTTSNSDSPCVVLGIVEKQTDDLLFFRTGAGNVHIIKLSSVLSLIPTNVIFRGSENV